MPMHPSAINLVDEDGNVSGITGAQVSNVYFGKYKQSRDGAGGYNIEPIKWRVLSNDSNKGTLFMLSDKNLDCKQYNAQYTSITWEYSTIRSWLNGEFINTAFSSDEQKAIKTTYVTNDDNPEYGTPGGNDTLDQIFLLSFDECMNAAYGFSSDYYRESPTREAINTFYACDQGAHNIGGGRPQHYLTGQWWLRSPGPEDRLAGCVTESGWLRSYAMGASSKRVAVRPAFNFNLKSAIFTSAAASGKSSGTVGADSLTQIGENPSDEWKMTVKDTAHQNFTVQSVTGCEKNDLTVKYSGAVAGDNEYISAIIKSSDGSVKYYGKLGLASAADGSTVKINADGKLDTTDTLYIFNEQCNDDYETDFASSLQEVTVQTTGHDWDKWTETKASTCSSKGEEERVCKNDSSHKETRDIDIDADAHDYDDGVVTTDPTCTEKGLKTFTCKHNAAHTRTEEVAATGHNWGEWEVTKAATEDEEGEETRICKNDAKHEEKRP